jgi:hypothetical protein
MSDSEGLGSPSTAMLTKRRAISLRDARIGFPGGSRNSESGVKSVTQQLGDRSSCVDPNRTKRRDAGVQV